MANESKTISEKIGIGGEMMVHPNSLANLKKGRRFNNADDSATKFGKKGAEATNRKKAQQKTSKEIVKMISGMPMTDKHVVAQFDKDNVKIEDRTYQTAFWYGIYAKVIKKGDVGAARLILAMLDELPDEAQKIDMAFHEENQVLALIPDDGRESNDAYKNPPASAADAILNE